MTKNHLVKRVIHPEYGELYQFYEVDEATKEVSVIHPFDAGLLKMAMEEEQPEILTITSKRGADASGYYKGERFVVRKGSKFAASTTAKCPKKYVRLREKLILEGLLIPLHNQLFLLEDVEFDTPGTAMGTVIGGRGRSVQDWKKDGGLMMGCTTRI